MGCLTIIELICLIRVKGCMKMKRMRRKPTFREISKTTKGDRSVNVYSRAGFTVDVPVDSTDNVLTVTTTPEEWLNKKLVIPLDKRDDQGSPIYKVVELKPRYTRVGKTRKNKK